MITLILPDSSKDWFDIIIAVIPIVVSIWAIVVASKLDKKTNNINLNSIYHNKIFDEILIEKLPKALLELKYFDNKFLDDNSLLEDCLGNLENKILFYKYKKPIFHRNLNEKIERLEDIVINNYQRQMTQREYNALKIQIDNKVKTIYKIIGDDYLGNTKS